MLLLACVVLSNFYNRDSIVDCLRLMDQFDLVEVTRLSTVMNSNMIFHLCRNFSSIFSQQGTRPQINHSRHRSLVIYFLAFNVCWCIGQSTMSFVLLEPEQKDPIHLMSLGSYIFCTELTAVVSFQFIFFSFAIQKRLELFTENLTIAFRKQKRNDWIKMFAHQCGTLMSAMRKANATFSIQVNYFVGVK